jgi:hypothetical protein
MAGAKQEGTSDVAYSRNQPSVLEDGSGNAERDPVRGALAEVRPLTAELRMLGSYPAAEGEHQDI